MGNPGSLLGGVGSGGAAGELRRGEPRACVDGEGVCAAHPGSPLLQTTPASWLCLQLLFIQPRDVQLASEGSVPVHSTSSSMIGPLPGPKAAPPRASVAFSNPRARQTTLASIRSHKLSHTVPHWPL